MTKFLLLRHGETESNTKGKLQGCQDSPLTETGKNQAHLLGKKLKELAPDYLYSSDLGRAKQTAKIISEHTGLTPNYIETMRERSFGIFEGLTHAEILKSHSDIWEQYKNSDNDFTVPEGESRKDVMSKACKTLISLGEKHPDSTVAIATHGGTIYYFLQYLLDFPQEEKIRLFIKNCSINTIIYKNGDFIIDAIGDTAHLEKISICV